MKRSGLVAGAGAFASQLPYGSIGKAAAAAEGATNVEVKRTVCTHCSVPVVNDHETAVIVLPTRSWAPLSVTV